MSNQSTEIAEIKKEIFLFKSKFEAVLSDHSISFEREAAFAVQAIMKNPYLRGAALTNRQSVINSIQQIAAIGISLNPAKKHAYLIPRDGEVCLDISYMGLSFLATSTGCILWERTKIVRQNDVFELNGLDIEPTHKYSPFAPEKERGEIVGVYTVIKTPLGDYLTHDMGIEKVYRIRERSPSFSSKKGHSGPWVTDPEEMIKKTCIKQASKSWPSKSERLEKAIHYLDNEGGQGILLENKADEIDITSLLAEMKTTKNDAELTQFWKDNIGQFAKYPIAHAKFKEEVIKHHNYLMPKNEEISQKTQSNTEEVPISELTGADHEIH
jgi:recombination protein RecT